MDQTTCVIIDDLPSINNHNLIVYNGNILTDRKNERKYLEKKCNEL